MTSVVRGVVGDIVWAAATDTGRVRGENQDAWMVESTPHGMVLAVADGMGGHLNGTWAARYACACLLEHLHHLNDGPNLRESVTQINERLRSEAVAIGTPGAGTTLTAALLRDGTLHWVHVGDSRLYILDSAGFRQLTLDHNLAAGLRGHPRLAHVLTRCLGSDRPPEPDTGSLPVPSALLLATDGLYQLVDDGALVEALVSGDPGTAAASLVGLANEAGGLDNITVVIARTGATG